MNICIFGAASNDIDKSYIEKTENLGRILAKNGHNLVFGAGRSGLMGAAARGMKEFDAHITGVIPKFFNEMGVEIIFEQCDEIIYTETMSERKAKMEDLADAFIIVPGGIGTFEEFFEVLTLKQLSRHTKPIAIYNINNYYENIEQLMATAFDNGFIKRDCRKIYFISDDADKIIEYVENDKPLNLDIHDLKN